VRPHPSGLGRCRPGLARSTNAHPPVYTSLLAPEKPRERSSGVRSEEDTRVGQPTTVADL
jgi:hypothetical protein